MEAIRKQATKLREQVAKQQQAVLSRLGKDAEIFDDEELHRHQKLQDLYSSTRVTKHFQKDIVRGVEGFISISTKQMQMAKRLAEDCCKFGTENVNAGFPLARIAQELGTSHSSMEEKRETMLEILNNQVSGPLRASIRGSPLEDARHLARSCDKLRQEVETQVDTERSYHRDVLAILEELHAEMILVMHIQDSSQSAAERDIFVASGDATQCVHDKHLNKNQDYDYFIGKVIHPFDAQADGELSLTVDDYVIVRQVSPNGWSEGECNGKTGWFPSAYLERQETQKKR
ncbi:SH3 domain-containing protein 2 isoform X2 [Cynara cardunculus var. scolymus]|uniref:SH3 domain-containing protein 2 isoform X2 n=1 Tax=Cynara cardunculus var. scolymus TaxID=59895 RepID=UPI000D6232DF|nr:SH3 domain-containing protein 2 isoform X2 [Cynara cardunculus var. scolymus]